jgi:hypothetical protein
MDLNEVQIKWIMMSLIFFYSNLKLLILLMYIIYTTIELFSSIQLI